MLKYRGVYSTGAGREAEPRVPSRTRVAGPRGSAGAERRGLVAPPGGQSRRRRRHCPPPDPPPPGACPWSATRATDRAPPDRRDRAWLRGKNLPPLHSQSPHAAGGLHLGQNSCRGDPSRPEKTPAEPFLLIFPLSTNRWFPLSVYLVSKSAYLAIRCLRSKEQSGSMLNWCYLF